MTKVITNVWPSYHFRVKQYSVIRCKAVNSVTALEIPVQLEPMQVSESIILLLHTVIARSPSFKYDSHCETWFDVKLVETWMHAQDTYALVCMSLSVCLQGRRLTVNLLMCTFELYMFIGVSMQLRELSEVSSDPILLVGCT